MRAAYHRHIRARSTGPRRLLAAALLPTILLALLAGCAGRPAPSLEPGHLPDLDRPQKAAAYTSPDDLDRPLFGPLMAQDLWRDWLAAWLAPWEREAPRYDAAEVSWGMDLFAARTMYGANLLPKPKGWLDALGRNADMASYPSLMRPAVATANTSFRVLPTAKPAFYDPAKAGEGFPFDMMQNSALPAGTPLLASHLSRDGAWVLCETDTVFGWVPATDLAFTDQAFMDAWRTAEHLTFLRDDVPVSCIYGRFRFMGKVGMVLPRITVLGGDGTTLDALIPARDEQGMAVLLTATLSARDAAAAPLPPTARTLSGLADAIMGRAYGWGGLFGERDCSAMTRDLLAPVGIALPRNSSQQAKAGLAFPLDGLDPARKRRTVLERGVPWLTLLYRPGHVMLYIGRQGNGEDGTPVILHDMWGLKTLHGDTEGRWVVGRTVITSLDLEAGVPGVAPGSTLLERLTAMTVLVPQALEREPYPVTEACPLSGPDLMPRPPAVQ